MWADVVIEECYKNRLITTIVQIKIDLLSDEREGPYFQFKRRQNDNKGNRTLLSMQGLMRTTSSLKIYIFFSNTCICRPAMQSAKKQTGFFQLRPFNWLLSEVNDLPLQMLWQQLLILIGCRPISTLPATTTVLRQKRRSGEFTRKMAVFFYSSVLVISFDCHLLTRDLLSCCKSNFKPAKIYF